MKIRTQRQISLGLGHPSPLEFLMGLRTDMGITSIPKAIGLTIAGGILVTVVGILLTVLAAWLHP